MNFNKYFAFLAILVLALLGQQVAEAHHHFMGKVGHKIDHAAKSVDKAAKTVAKAKTVIEVGGAVAGALAA